MRRHPEQPSAEEVAREYRQRLRVDHLCWLDPMTILMKLRHEVPGADFEIVAAEVIAPALATWDFSQKLIRIGDQTFAAANGPRSDGRARFDIFHEVIHAMGRHKGDFNRLLSRSEIPKYAVKLRDVESRTDKITAAFMAPRHLISDGWSAREVAFFFGMSLESARIRIEEVRGRVRRAKSLPDSVEQLLLDLNKGSRR